MKKLILVASLFLGACATCPRPEIVETPIAIHAKHISLDSCPLLPIYSLGPDSNWDLRLKAWEATVIILQGCVKSRDQIIEEINK